MTDGGEQTFTTIDSAKLAVIWFGTLVGTFTLQQWVLAATGIFTALQIFVLIRDKIFKRKD